MFKSLEEANSACANLHNIYLTVSRYQISGEPVPYFFATSGSSQTMGAKLLRDDTSQLTKDMATRQPPAVKEGLVSNDQILISIDKQIWLGELTHESILKHNEAHPDHAYKDVSDVIKLAIDAHQRFVDIGNEFRQKIADIDRRGGR